MSQSFPLSLQIENVGPIRSLNSNIKVKRSMIYAVNGTGKSFLARAIKLLDEDLVEEQEQVNMLLSEEANSGYFKLTEGPDTIIDFEFSKTHGVLKKEVKNYIFHVFSEDYITEELRSRSYNLDGNIEKEIIVGKTNNKIKDLEIEINKLNEKTSAFEKSILVDFTDAKKNLQREFSIRSNLGAYSSLSLPIDLSLNDSIYDSYEDAVQAMKEQKDAYEIHKSIPENIDLPSSPSIKIPQVDLIEIEKILSNEITISSIADSFKRRIANDANFFLKGTDLYKENKDQCPFCLSDITYHSQEVINKYIEYFEDEEAKIRKQIEDTILSLESMIQQLEINTTLLAHESLKYNEVSKYFSHQEPQALNNLDDVQRSIRLFLSEIKEKLIEKKDKLGEFVTFSQSTNVKLQNWTALEENFHNVSSEISEKINKINSLYNNSSEIRRNIQGSACRILKDLFLLKHKDPIEDYISSKISKLSLEHELQEEQKSNADKCDARELVADTFEELLLHIFHGKYTFDKNDFSIKRQGQNILRGADKTFSDGEKSIIAFCYYLAQSHMKVSRLADYQKLFFIIDDPVSSLSFNYIYSISEILKKFCINSVKIKLSFNDQEEDTEKVNLLLLTHNEYLFNIINTQGILHSKRSKEDIYQLRLNTTTKEHELKPQKTYLTPHYDHLSHVLKVSRHEIEPTVSTANSIRFILESVWRFCYPNLPNLNAFMQEASTTHRLSYRSSLVNDLSHGGKFHHDFHHNEEDLIIASKDAVSVIDKYASGQIEEV